MDIKVPTLGESVTDVTVGKWHKQVGDTVAQDEVLMELESDKITVEVNAPEAGILKEIAAPTGTNLKVGGVLARLETRPGAAKSKPSKAAAATSKTVEADPQSKKVAPKKLEIPQMVTIRQSMVQPEPKSFFSRISTADEPVERVKMSRLRHRIAERLKESQNTAALLTTFNEIDMSAVMDLRTRYKDLFTQKYDVKLGFMSFFLKATAIALKEFPIINCEMEGDDILYKNYYHIGVAVSTDQGLVVPVVRHADRLSFAEAEKQVIAYSQKARDGKLTMEDLMGGTFTITNGGIFGSLMSTPIVNPPQSAILGLHQIQPRSVAVGEVSQVRPMMYVALTYDHRVIDGKDAVSFLVRVKELIESPERLLVLI